MITVPLRDIPGYTPDGPVSVALGPSAAGLSSPTGTGFAVGTLGVMLPADLGPTTRLVALDGQSRVAPWPIVHFSLILDATGAASLARAVAASRGLNPGRGLQWWIDDADRSLGMQGDVTAWFVPCAGIAAFETVVPALADINPDDPSAPLLALAAVARVVLGATTEATP